MGKSPAHENLNCSARICRSQKRITSMADSSARCCIRTSTRRQSATDFTEDLKKIDVPTLAMHGDDDQIAPDLDAGVLSAKLVTNAQLEIYPGFPHDMPIIHADIINPELLAFIKE
jgi:pimeloyl-ACP methyl ester carboxylesterase